MKPGEVRKSPDGWRRFQSATDNGRRKRPAFQRPVSVKRTRRGPS